ncbi:FAD-dependent monooxygenase [Actinomadura kijaniata]
MIGGGIGGLAAAVALHRIGWRATVLERAARFEEVGVGLSLSPNALRALDALGLGDRARAVGVPTWATHAMRTPSGGHLMRAPDQGVPPLLAFRRAALHQLLLKAVPDGRVRTGAQVTALRANGPTATVICDDEEFTADLVVAADGIHSTTRGLLWPDAPPPRFLNYTAWLGLAELDHPVGPDGPPELRGSMTLGRGQALLIHPVGARQTYWALLAAADRPGVRHPDELAEARRRVGAWHQPVPALLDATPADQVRRIDIHEAPPLSTFVHRNVALLGDAAHAMSPDRGQGAGQSIEDAVVLAAALATEPTVTDALTRYDRERRPRTQTTAESARRAGQQVLNAGTAAHHLTTLSLRLTPSALWNRLAPRALAPLWDWQPPSLPDQPTHPASP